MYATPGNLLVASCLQERFVGSSGQECRGEAAGH
jgi:hypothetical protein